MASIAYKTLEIPAALAHLYQELAISPEMLLKNYALTHIYAMVQKYEVENTYFEGKYRCGFFNFQAKIEAMAAEENFEWEDDLLDWEFVMENLNLWAKKAGKLSSCKT